MTAGTAARAMCLAAALSVPAASSAETLTLGVAEAVDRALTVSHLVRAAGFDTARAGEGVRKARAMKVLPETKLTLSTGLVPEARGDILHSPDTSRDTDSLGPYYQAELKVVQPLLTFGRGVALEEAARHGLSAVEARGDLTRQTVALDTVRAYWGLSAAVRGEQAARDLKSDYDKLLKEVEERVGREDSEVDDGDLLEVRSNGYGIDRGVLDATGLRAFSLDALRALLALPPGEDPVTRDEPAPVVSVGEDLLDEVAARGVSAHPEVRALEEGVRVLEAKAAMARANRWPIVYLGAGFEWGEASNRDRQDNPFITDKFNYRRYGAELGVTWDPNLYRQSIDVREAENEHLAAVEKLVALRQKTAAEVRRAAREAARNAALLESARASLAAAKSWRLLAGDNWDLGIGEVNKVIDAYQAYHRLRATEIEREHDLHVSLARLAFVLGDMRLYLQWVRDGNLVF